MKDMSHGAAWLAGEASGDLLASRVLPHLRQAMGGAPQYGIGGPRMIEAGLESWYPSETLAVRGYVEVVKRIPALLKLRREMIARVKSVRPRVFIGVDAPDFNLAIEGKLRAAGIPTVHFVSPSIWAWRPERIEVMRRNVDMTLLIFPMEEKIYRDAGVPAVYIGHPLASVIPMEPDTEGARRALQADPKGEPLIAVLPGSRIDEVKGCAPIFFRACERMVARLGGGFFIVPAVDENRRAQIERVVADGFPLLKGRLRVVTGQSHRVLESADGVMVASGTAALEAALFKKPMVVGYTMPAISAMLMRKKGLIPYVSLPNILSGEAIVPEFLHYNCRADWIASRLAYEMQPERSALLRERFTEMHRSLTRPTERLALEAIQSVMRPL
jgi:lipid-A-disaccharide synthase